MYQIKFKIFLGTKVKTSESKDELILYLRQIGKPELISQIEKST